MSITNYTTLDAALDNYLKRTDLSDRIPEFIALTEARYNYGSEDEQFGTEALRCWLQEASSDLSIGSDGTASAPSDYLETVRLYIQASGVETELTYYPRPDFYARGFAQTAGIPTGYTIEASNFVFGDAQTGTPKLLYYKKLTALDSADGDSTNDLLTTSPGVYLYGALFEANLFIKEWDEALRWMRLYRSAVGALNAMSRRRQMGGGPYTSKPMAVA